MAQYSLEQTQSSHIVQSSYTDFNGDAQHKKQAQSHSQVRDTGRSTEPGHQQEQHPLQDPFDIQELTARQQGQNSRRPYTLHEGELRRQEYEMQEYSHYRLPWEADAAFQEDAVDDCMMKIEAQAVVISQSRYRIEERPAFLYRGTPS